MTRFYLPSAGTSPVASPGFSSLWTHTGANVVAPLLRTKSGTALVQRFGGAAASTLSNVLLGTFVSEPLAAQTIAGTWSAVLNAAQSVDGNASLQMVVRVISNTGSTTRGTVYAGHTAANNQTSGSLGQEFPLDASAATRIIPSTAGSSVVAQAGDRLVIELGARVDDNTATVQSRLRFGDTGADHPLSAGSAATGCPWVETSQTLAFQGDPTGIMARYGDGWADGLPGPTLELATPVDLGEPPHATADAVALAAINLGLEVTDPTPVWHDPLGIRVFTGTDWAPLAGTHAWDGTQWTPVQVKVYGPQAGPPTPPTVPAIYPSLSLYPSTTLYPSG